MISLFISHNAKLCNESAFCVRILVLYALYQIFIGQIHSVAIKCRRNIKEIIRYKNVKARMRHKVSNVTSSIMHVAIMKK